MIELLIVFGFIFIFNLIPVFAPPTWMTLSYIEIIFNMNPMALALAGALGATAGRLVLAKSSHLVKEKLLSDRSRANVDYLKRRLEKNKKFTFGAALFYAFSPFPSNHLFIAYGLTGLSLWTVTLPFFLGRLASYSFWIFNASKLDAALAASNLSAGKFFTGYFLIAQIFFLTLIYFIVRLDWEGLFESKKLNLISNKK